MSEELMTNRDLLRRLRVQYRLERGRHDRCCDVIDYGRRGAANALRREIGRAADELQEAMQLVLWKYQPIRYLGPGKGYE